MAVTLSDVARRAGVSIATASRVLNSSPYGVKPELRDRVLVAAQALNYLPNAHAQALARTQSQLVGVLLHEVSDPYFAEITSGIQQVATAEGRLVMLCNTYQEPERELAYARTLIAHRAEAIILAGGGIEDPAYCHRLAAQLIQFTQAGGRVVMIGRHHVPGDAVLPDNLGGGRAAARALAEMGHRRIGVISGPRLTTTMRDRLDGFRNGLREAGVTLPHDLVVEAHLSREGGAKAVRELLVRRPDLTAIFALNDLIAIGALAALRDLGLSVPGRISVMGFDDMPSAQDVTPALSTVRIPMVEMGRRALALALAPRQPGLSVVPIPTAVVLRGTTGPTPRQMG